MLRWQALAVWEWARRRLMLPLSTEPVGGELYGDTCYARIPSWRLLQ